MSMAESQWPPRVGDHVQIAATGASGMVMDIDAVRHFLVAIYSHEQGAVTTAPYRTFRLRELGPESVPAAVAPPRRGGRQLPAAG